MADPAMDLFSSTQHGRLAGSSTSSWGGGGINIVFSAGQVLRPWRREAAVQDMYDRLLALMAAA